MRTAVPLAAIFATLQLAGCSDSNATAPPAAKPTEVKVVDTGPTKVELSTPKVEWRETEVVKFEIPYRFTSGSPTKVYQCRITFPKEGSAGLKPMEAWELKQEGIIKTGIPANGKIVTAYAIELYEAEAPDKTYFLVSNKVEGEIPPPELKPTEPVLDANPAPTPVN